MKALIISALSIGLLIISWSIFVNYADENLHKLKNEISEEITINIKNGNWDQAEEAFKDISKEWHKNKKIYSLYIDTVAINETDYSIAKAKAYIEVKNEALAAGELAKITEQLGFLHLNELISIDNVF